MIDEPDKPYKIEWHDNLGYDHLTQFATKEEADAYYHEKYMDDWVTGVSKRYPSK